MRTAGLVHKVAQCKQLKLEIFVTLYSYSQSHNVDFRREKNYNGQIRMKRCLKLHLPSKKLTHQIRQMQFCPHLLSPHKVSLLAMNKNIIKKTLQYLLLFFVLLRNITTKFFTMYTVQYVDTVKQDISFKWSDRVV